MKSDDVKNWVTAAAIVVGGGWTLYQWDTLFPKTAAEIEISVADLRARTHGELSVQLAPPPSGEEPTAPDGRTLFEICGSDDGDGATLRFSLRAALAFRSNAPVPVRVDVTDLMIAEIRTNWPEIAETGSDTPFLPTSLGKVRSASLTEDAFIGGLSWTHVEPGGQSAIAVLGDVFLPFDCAYGGSTLTPTEVAIGIKALIRPVDAATDRDPAERSFFRICKINADGGSTCPVGDGGGDGDGQGGAADGSTFKVIAQ